jgi:hypothetical protein
MAWFRVFSPPMTRELHGMSSTPDGPIVERHSGGAAAAHGPCACCETGPTRRDFDPGLDTSRAFYQQIGRID